MLHDYYAILGVSTQASQDDLKLAYRKLAKQYHPDVVGSNAANELYFATIKLAYDTLTQPHLRQQYLEQRWLHKAEGKQMVSTKLTTIGEIIKQVVATEQTVHYMNGNYNNEQRIALMVNEALSENNITILQAANDTTANQTIFNTLIKLVPTLPCNYVNVLAQQLLQLSYTNTQQNIEKFNKAKQKRKLQEKIKKYSWVLIVALVILLLWFIAKW